VTARTHDFAPEAAENKTLMLADFLRVFRKYLWLLTACSVGFAVLAFIWAKRQPRQMIALQSRDVALKVIEDPRLDLIHNPLFNPAKKSDIETNPQTRNDLVGALVGNMDVERVPKSELVSLTYRSLSPVLSAAVANAIVDAYMEENFQHRYQGSKEIKGWLNRELSDLKAKVQGEQSDLLNMELKLGIFSTSATTEVSLPQLQLQELLSESIKAQTQRFQSDAEYQTLAQDTGSGFPPISVPGAQVLNNLNVELAQLEAQEAALTERYGPGYGPLRQIQNQVANTRKNIADLRRQLLESAQQDEQAAAKTEADIENNIAQVKAEAKGNNPELVRYQVLKAQYLADQQLYNSLLTLLSAGGIEAGLKTQETNRMSTADIPTLPSRPRVALSTAAGFGIGLFLSILIVGTITVVSDTVETVEQIEEALALPVLAAVPVYKLDPGDPAARLAPLATLNAPRSAAAEAYRILRTSVNLMPLGKESRVIGFTSCGPGEGKSTTALNLAVSFAQQGRRVLMVDADLRKPSLAERVKLPEPNAPGLSRFLSDRTLDAEDCIQPLDTVPGLSVMPVQEIPPFPSELLGQGRLEELVAWARQRFDVVIFDTPPALLVTDALIVAQSLDVILLVARVGMAQRRALRRLREELARFPEKQIAVVVNAVPQSQSYYGGYGNKHGYYGTTSGKK
jgi:succinoglycan biosynthesis transport protein ExoP